MNKPKLYLHIGLPKTGTSFIQASFGKQRKKLIKQGILYPEAGIYGSGHSAFGAALLDEDLRSVFFRSNLFGNTEPPENVRDDILFEMGLRGRQIKTVILSAESLPMLNQARIEFLSELFLPYFDVQVVAFLRRQDILAESLRAQAYRANQAFYVPEDTLNKYNINYCFITILRRWSEVFGKPNITIAEYPEKNSSDKLVDRMMSVFKLPISAMPKDRLINQALGRDALEYIHFFTRLTYGGDDYFRALKGIIAVENKIPSDEKYRYFFSPQIREEIIAVHDPSNKEIEEEFGCSLFRGPIADPGDSPWEPYPGLTDDKKAKFDKVLKKYSPDSLIPDGPIDRGYTV